MVLGIAERVRERAADGAWIVDFTNPVGIVTRALLGAGHRAVGLCNVNIGVRRQFARLLGVDPERAARRPGRAQPPDLVPARAARRRGRAAGAARGARGRARRATSSCRGALLDELGAIPSYYLHYFYAHDLVLEEQLDGGTRAEEVMEIERGLLELYRDPALDTKPALLEQRGGAFYSEAALALVAALEAADGAVEVVDVANGSSVPGLAPDDVVEVAARVGPDGPEPLPQPPVAPELLGLIQHVAAYERLAVRAALSGEPADVRRALLAHPLVGQWEPAEELERRLLAEGAEHLPQFAVRSRS